MRSNNRSRGLALVVLSCLAANAVAVDYRKEYDRKIKATRDIGALGDDLAGDKVNFLNGTVSFHVTDASLPGNNALPVALGRSYNVDFDKAPGAFADWDLDVPYISTVMTANAGWIVDTATPTNRCSVAAPATGAPPTVVVPEDNGFRRQVYAFSPSDYFHGYTMHLPGSSQTLLLASASTTQRPSTGETYHWTTNQDWWFSCMAASAWSGGGQGFKAIAPDGTIYWFDKMIMRGATPAERSDNWSEGGLPQQFHFTLDRAEYRLYATRVQDRFGNFVAYNWNGDTLGSITSSDGRTITLGYTGGVVSSVSDGTRTWNYAYTGGSLSQVTLPDQAKWLYDFAALSSLARPDMDCVTPPGSSMQGQTWDCYGGGWYVSSVARHAVVIHPSGARIDFDFDGRYAYSLTAGLRGSMPLALVQKKVSGPGLADATWKFGSTPSVDQARSACNAGTCPAYVVTDVLGPDGALTRRIFDTNNLLQGQLRGNASTAVPSGGSPAITSSQRWGTAHVSAPSPLTGTAPLFYEEIDNRYVGTETVPYAVIAGANPGSSGDSYTSERRLPVKTRNFVRQGVTFKRNVAAFDTFARPVTVDRSSTGLVGPASGYGRSDTTTYSDNPAKWVLGMVTSVRDIGTNKLVSETAYDPVLLLPTTRKSFGVVSETLGYNADGTLASVKDGAGNTIGLSSWYRGVPRAITYPAVPDEAGVMRVYSDQAAVNNTGTIASTTDELGYVHAYGYDGMGRLASITYPAETPAWNPLGRSLVPVAVAEYGLAAGHWKQSVWTGNGRTTTLYDARFNPILTITEDTANAATRSFVVRRYDSLGREVFASYPVASLGSINDALTGTTTSYDALGRVASVSQHSELGALTTTTQYLAGFQTSVVNPRATRTTTSYQAFDNPSTEAPVRITKGVGLTEQQTTTIDRDAFGKPLKITRSGPAG